MWGKGRKKNLGPLRVRDQMFFSERGRKKIIGINIDKFWHWKKIKEIHVILIPPIQICPGPVW